MHTRFPLTYTLRLLCVIVNANCRGRQPSNKATRTNTHTHTGWVVLWWANVCMRVSFLMVTVSVGVTLDKETALGQIENKYSSHIIKCVFRL